jgi:hypothetical protein
MGSNQSAIMHIGQYLSNNCERGIIYEVDKSQDLEDHVNTDLLVDGVLQILTILTMFYQEMVLLFVMRPLVWCSKLQTKIVFSTAEAEYNSMSHALQETIPIQNLVKRVDCIFQLPNQITGFPITVHEDNIFAIATAESLKFTPPTKLIAIK